MSDTYTLYNPTVMEHFMNPRNMGDIQDADGVGEVEHVGGAEAPLVSVIEEGVPPAPLNVMNAPAEPTLTPSAVATFVPSPVILPTAGVIVALVTVVNLPFAS
jgi:hypothetical protein